MFGKIFEAIVGFVMLVYSFTLGPIVELSRSKHSHPAAHPARLPPDPKFFPHYMQNRSGLWLRWAEWHPPASRKPIGAVFIVSGLGEHTARWEAVGLFLAAKGYSVFTHDHQGQGLSEGDRKHVERFTDYVDDLHDFVRARLAADVSLASLPRYVLGHSMGGLIATHFLLRHPKAFNGAVLSAPALVPDPDVATPFMQKLAFFVGDIMPKLAVGKNLPVHYISRNEQVTLLYANDPAIATTPLRARWGAEMLKAMESVWNKKEQLTFPFILLHGSADRIVNIAGSERLMQEAPSRDKKFIVYPGAYHEYLNDAQFVDRALADIVGFFESHTSTDAPLSW